MIDHGYDAAHRRGNVGNGYKIGIIDVPPYDKHERQMETLVRRIIPGAEIVWGDARGSRDLWRLAVAGCPVIAMPVIFQGSTWLQDWSSRFQSLKDNGVLLFGGTGNGVAETQFPATDPNVIACGTVSATDGHRIPKWSSTRGPFDLGCLSGDLMSSGACVMAAAMALLWMPYGQQTHSRPQDRIRGFRQWFENPRLVLPGGGYWLDCSTL